MPFIDYEDLDLTLGSIVTPNPDFHELGSPSATPLSPESAEADTPPTRFPPLRRNNRRRPVWQGS